MTIMWVIADNSMYLECLQIVHNKCAKITHSYNEHKNTTSYNTHATYLSKIEDKDLTHICVCVKYVTVYT